MIKTMRKNAIVKYVGKDIELTKTWGELFEVYHKEGNFVKVSSLKKPYFGVVASLPIKDCQIVTDK